MCKSDVVGTGVPFERVGRITGYAAKISRWNNAKREELKDRVEHKLQNKRPTCDC